MTDHYQHLLELFQRVERAAPTVGRTAAQWRDLARTSRFPYDHRIDGLLAAFATDGVKLVAFTPESAQSAPKRTRSDALTRIIEKAREEAPDPDSATSVWEVLVRLAQGPNPPAPVIGYAEGEIKYRADTETGFKFLSHAALKERIARITRREMPQKLAKAR
jgi:hypothetical protein